MTALLVQSNLTSGNVSGNTTQKLDGHTNKNRMVLLSIDTVVLLSGVLCMVVTVRVLQFTTRSLTAIAVLNLIFTHFLFLVTLPFRIHYYVVGKWTLGDGWCKVTSSMIHIHLYMSFICYVVILVTRLLAFHKRANQVEFHRRTHALLCSLAIWVVVMVVVPCIVHFCYGNREEQQDTSKCFEFGHQIKDGHAKAFNYAISAVIIAVSVLLTGLQAHVLLQLYREYGHGCYSQQVFGAQVKSLCFALIMMVCFVPYHMFRMYYITNLKLQPTNEVFLSLTTLNCLDMLTFLGKGTWVKCYK
ncbi:unnamed protein product [Lota lota]